MILLSLIGEQPIPNLLAARALNADNNLLFHTDRTKTIAEHLASLLQNPRLELIPAFDLHQAQEILEAHCQGEITINLTGGTKTMSLAAYETARQKHLPFIYLESDQGQSHLYRYKFHNDQPMLCSPAYILPALIEIDDYLQAYLGPDQWKPRKPRLGDRLGAAFEEAIKTALEQWTKDIKHGVSILAEVEIDFVIRFGNQIGLVEAKVGKNGIKAGLDHLGAAGDQRALGTYAQKILISDQDLYTDSNLSNHLELAKARRITIISLASFQVARSLCDQEIASLRDGLQKSFRLSLP
jgi:hypothetical protein